jgi:multiple sugar transport system permease protein
MATPTADGVPMRVGHAAHPGRRLGRRKLMGYLLVSPALALSLVFFVIPMVLLIAMSFYNWPLLGTVRLAGLYNYKSLLSDGVFLKALEFSGLFTAVNVPLTLIVGYTTAIMVRGTGRFVSFLRTAFFLPVVIGLTAASYMLSVLLFPGTGIVNIILKDVGLTNGETAWFGGASTAFWAVVVLTVWKTMGILMILLMAGMQAIPIEFYEAAKVDGAGWWRREALITFPLVRRQLALCLVLAVSGSFLVFDQFYVLTKGGPSGQTMTAVMYTYSTSFERFDLGYGAVLSLVLTAIALIVTVIQLRTLRASTGEFAA